MATDMKDKELKFWTKHPGNCFLVACLSSDPDKVVGCVCRLQICWLKHSAGQQNVCSEGFQGIGSGEETDGDST